MIRLYHIFVLQVKHCIARIELYYGQKLLYKLSSNLARISTHCTPVSIHLNTKSSQKTKNKSINLS